jgi:hypothetical protein
VSGCSSVRQCAAVRVALCGSARSSRVCVAVLAAVCGSVYGSMQLSSSVLGNVRLTSSPEVCGNSSLRIISYTSCRNQTAPSYTKWLKIYIHMRYKHPPSCNLSLRIISYTGCSRGHTNFLLHHAAHNIRIHMLWPALSCDLSLRNISDIAG